MTISLPPAMIKQVEQARKIEHRTRSELIREALRTYFSGRQIPVTSATAAELKAIQRSRAEFKRGSFVTLNELLDSLENPSRKHRRKSR